MMLWCGEFQSILIISLIPDINHTELRSYLWERIAEEELLALRIVNSM
jgi:hypothetical protein